VKEGGGGGDTKAIGEVMRINDDDDDGNAFEPSFCCDILFHSQTLMIWRSLTLSRLLLRIFGVGSACNFDLRKIDEI